MSKISTAISDTPALAAAFERLARGDETELSVDLVQLDNDFALEGTLARTHCYALALDGMGWPRVDLLIENICMMVVDYAIPRSKIEEAAFECNKKGHKAPLMRLREEARSLFTHLKQSGEGGELLLFCLAEKVLGYPQVLAKMHLKTATAVHYHGADGVHASVDADTGQLCLWWGESKLHATAAGATKECIASIAPFLIEPQSTAAKRARDLQLLRYGVDLGDPALEAAIKTYLDVGNAYSRKLKFGGIGLVGFDHGCYPPHPKKGDADAIAAAIIENYPSWQASSGTHIANHQLEEIDMHLFFLPFPSVGDFRKKMLKAVGAS